MRRRALSTVFAGAALVAALTLAFPAPASAAGREPGPGVRAFAGWLGAAWSRAVEAISLTIDPNGSTSDGGAGPAGDLSWTIDPDGSTVSRGGEPPSQPAGDLSWTIDPNG